MTMNTHLTLTTLSLALALCGCSDDGTAGADGTTGSNTSTDGDDDGIGTLPVTSAPPGDDGVGETTADDATATATGDTGSGTSDPDGTGTDTDAESDGTTTGGGEESSSGGTATLTIDWCRLQSPPEANVAVDEAFAVYGRVYVEGVTDQSVDNDPHPSLVAEVGWGDDGSDPAAGAWTWTAAAPNPGWDSVMFGEPNNDEYMADLAIDTAGTWDYAVRFSGDGGNEWVYCDLDDVLTGGYTPDQAGNAVVE